jgi:enamine deaminase RidA (YjgF/YER057c/UK114 family)
LRQIVKSPSPFAARFGFSAAVRVGNVIAVSGTVGRRPDGTFAPDLYEQTRQAIANIAAALEQAGASLDDVVRTRIFMQDLSDFEPVAKAHLEAFGSVQPASTLVGIKLALPEMLVEIEVDAVVEA